MSPGTASLEYKIPRNTKAVEAIQRTEKTPMGWEWREQIKGGPGMRLVKEGGARIHRAKIVNLNAIDFWGQ